MTILCTSAALRVTLDILVLTIYPGENKSLSSDAMNADYGAGGSTKHPYIYAGLTRSYGVPQFNLISLFPNINIFPNIKIYFIILKNNFLVL